MRCLLINRRSLLLALRLLWKTPIFPSNSRFPRLCAKCLLKLKRLVSIWRIISERSEERFSRNAETDLVCRLLLEKKKSDDQALSGSGRSLADGSTSRPARRSRSRGMATWTRRTCRLFLFFLSLPPPPSSTLFPYTTLFRSPIFPSNSRFPRLCAKCLLKLKRLVSIWRIISEERFSRNAETDLVCRLLLEKKKKTAAHAHLSPNRIF